MYAIYSEIPKHSAFRSVVGNLLGIHTQSFGTRMVARRKKIIALVQKI